MSDALETSTEDRLGLIEKFLRPFMGTNNESKVEVLKQFEEDTNTVHDVLYIPANTVDGHSETIDEEGVKNLVKAFNEGVDAGTVQPSFFHKHKTKTFSIGKAWYLEKATMIGDDLMPEFTPMVEITFKSKRVFDARVNGEISGLSIGALGLVEQLKQFTAETKITDFSFMFKGAHLAYTDWSVGGAASMINNTFEVVEKSMAEELTKGQKKLLEEVIEEEFEPLEKKLQVSEDSDNNTPSTPAENAGAQDAGVDTKTLKKGQDMSDKENPELQDALLLIKAMKIEKALAKYNLSEEVTETLAKALASLESPVAVTKAFDEIVSAKDAEIATLKEDKEAVTKQLDVQPEAKSELEQKIDKELGHSETQEAPEEKTPNQLIKSLLSEKLAKIDNKEQA